MTPIPADDPLRESAALRADPHDGEGLDVERLARAYHHETCKLKAVAMHSCLYKEPHRRTAAAIAARYAALSKEQGRSPEGE